MRKFTIVALNEALRLHLNGRNIILTLLALYGAIVCLPFYFLFQLSVVLALLPLWLTAKVRGFVARKTEQHPFVGV